MGITWEVWKIQIPWSYPWDSNLRIWGHHRHGDFFKSPVILWQPKLRMMVWLWLGCTSVEQRRAQGRIFLPHKLFLICPWAFEMLSSGATIYYILMPELGCKSSCKREGGYLEWVPYGHLWRSPFIKIWSKLRPLACYRDKQLCRGCEESPRPCCKPWARVMGCGTVLIRSLLYPQSHITPQIPWTEHTAFLRDPSTSWCRPLQGWSWWTPDIQKRGSSHFNNEGLW